MICCQIPEPFPVICRSRSNFKRSNKSFQSNHGMYFEAKIGLFFRRTLAVIGSIAAKRLTITGSSKLAYCQRETVYNKIPTVWHCKSRKHFLTYQFCCLKKSSPGSVKTTSAANSGK